MTNETYVPIFTIESSELEVIKSFTSFHRTRVIIKDHTVKYYNIRIEALISKSRAI